MNCFASLRTRAIRAFGRFVADDAGATAVEYGLMVALISVATMATLFAVGEGIKTTLNTLINALAGML